MQQRLMLYLNDSRQQLRGKQEAGRKLQMQGAREKKLNE